MAFGCSGANPRDACQKMLLDSNLLTTSHLQRLLTMASRVVLTLMAIGSAVLHIRAEYHGPQYHIYLFKPLTMAFILLIAILKAKKEPSSILENGRSEIL